MAVLNAGINVGFGFVKVATDFTGTLAEVR
jgi:hypothetical protein